MKLKTGITGSGTGSFTALAALLCLVAPAARADNPWNPYATQSAPAPAPAPVPAPAPQPKPKYYQEPAATAPSANGATQKQPDQFAPPDLDQRLSQQAGTQSYLQPFGTLPMAPATPYAPPPPPYGLPDYPVGTLPYSYPGGYGGNGGYIPPTGNFGWGGPTGNYFSPFGFW